MALSPINKILWDSTYREKISDESTYPIPNMLLLVIGVDDYDDMIMMLRIW